MDLEGLAKKKRQLDRLRPLSPPLVANLDEWFRVELTYTSNALEGNTLTRRETAVVLEKGLTIGGKTLREHLEATNHAQALDLIRTLIQKKPADVRLSDILEIHSIILQGIDPLGAGRLRSIPARISGSLVVLPNPRKVSGLMDQFANWLTSKTALHPVTFAAEAHYQLVTIHPFVDGNGRTARLLMNLLLMMRGYPPAVIRPVDRLAYISALENAQLGGAKDDYESLIVDAVDRSLDIYLNAARGDAAPVVQKQGQLKIGQVAKAAGVTVPTIRYWTKEGLLDVADVTASGYALYDRDAIKRCEAIQAMQAERRTLNEIRLSLRKQ